MIRDDLRRALEVLGDRLPRGRVVVLVRRAFGDHAVSFIRGDVEKVTGHPAGTFEAPTREWMEIVHPADRDAVRERLDDLPGRERLRLEYRVRCPDGGVRWLREDLTVDRKAPGAPPEVVGVLTDGTVERSVQGRLSRLQAELWRARKMESVGKVAAEVAHDFNNLLTVILASCDLLRHDPGLPEEATEETRVIRESAIRGRELVSRILSFASRLPGGGSALDLSEGLAEMREILDRVAGGSVSLEIELPEGEGWPVMVDQAHAEQVVLNLVDNARDAMPAGGELAITVRHLETEERIAVKGDALEPGRWVELAVSDTGSGIADHIRERVFEPFYSTKEEREGAGGFGLATVLRIVQGYGGGVRVETEEDRGTTFRVFFPVREAGAVAGAADLQPVESGLQIEESGGDRLRILVVDDDADVRSVVERILEREGHSVAGVASAGEALRAFDRVRPSFDLLLADVVLPERSGPAVHRALARRVGDLPVVFMSGYGRERAIQEGMVDVEAFFLQKPFPPNELLRVVREVEHRLRGRDRPGLADAGEAGG